MGCIESANAREGLKSPHQIGTTTYSPPRLGGGIQKSLTLCLQTNILGRVHYRTEVSNTTVRTNSTGRFGTPKSFHGSDRAMSDKRLVRRTFAQRNEEERWTGRLRQTSLHEPLHNCELAEAAPLSRGSISPQQARRARQRFSQTGNGFKRLKPAGRKHPRNEEVLGTNTKRPMSNQSQNGSNSPRERR